MRFPEFTEEWNKYLFDDIAQYKKGPFGSALKKEIFVPESNDTIKIYEQQNAIKKDWKLGRYFISKDYFINHMQQFVVKAGDIIVSCAGTIGEMYELPQNAISGVFNQALMRVRVNTNLIDKNIFIEVFSSMINTFSKIYSNGSAIKNIPPFADLKRTVVFIPMKNEQEKISKFISLIDERIATQNKIIEDLKKLKSAIVEMILCKQGGVLLKLGDVGSFIRGLTYSSEDIAEDINATTVIRANNLNYGNNVSKKDVVYVNKKPTEIQILRKGDIVICMANGSSSLVGKNSYYSFDDRQSTIGAFCGIYRSSQPLVKWLMQSQRYRRLVYQSLQGGNGAIANLNGDDILNMTFYVVEDKKSVSILSALVLIENSIAVNEKLQELYSMQKEYLLQHLFI